jgi:DNA-binding beta-propeller fold protein YncE
MKIAIRIITAALLLGASSAAYAEIAVSANDGKQLRPGEAPNTRTTDNVSVIDLGRYPPKVLGAVNVPASMIGAPSAVAVARDESFALVTALQQLNAAGELEPVGIVSVIDLADKSAPKVLQSLQVSPGSGGVSINPAGTLALVTSNSDDTISVFSIANKRLTPAGKIQLPAKSRPTDVTFAPDGRSAVAIAQGSGKLMRLNVSGSNVAVGDMEVETGVQPYGGVFSRDGKAFYNTNLGGAVRPAGAPEGSRTGTVTAVDLASRTVNSVEVGQTPEHVVLSPDGKYLAAIVHNGSAAAPTAPGYHPYGLLQIYQAQGAKLTRVAEAQTSPWCQGGAFSDNGRTFLLQCAMTKEIEVYRWDGKTLGQDKAASIKVNARPGSLSTARSR